jgi:hypothetical protein
MPIQTLTTILHIKSTKAIKRILQSQTEGNKNTKKNYKSVRNIKSNKDISSQRHLTIRKENSGQTNQQGNQKYRNTRPNNMDLT